MSDITRWAKFGQAMIGMGLGAYGLFLKAKDGGKQRKRRRQERRRQRKKGQIR